MNYEDTSEKVCYFCSFCTVTKKRSILCLIDALLKCFFCQDIFFIIVDCQNKIHTSWNILLGCYVASSPPQV